MYEKSKRIFRQWGKSYFNASRAICYELKRSNDIDDRNIFFFLNYDFWWLDLCAVYLQFGRTNKCSIVMLGARTRTHTQRNGVNWAICNPWHRIIDKSPSLPPFNAMRAIYLKKMRYLYLRCARIEQQQQQQKTNRICKKAIYCDLKVKPQTTAPPPHKHTINTSEIPLNLIDVRIRRWECTFIICRTLGHTHINTQIRFGWHQHGKIECEKKLWTLNRGSHWDVDCGIRLFVMLDSILLPLLSIYQLCRVAKKNVTSFPHIWISNNSMSISVAVVVASEAYTTISHLLQNTFSQKRDINKQNQNFPLCLFITTTTTKKQWRESAPVNFKLKIWHTYVHEKSLRNCR